MSADATGNDFVLTVTEVFSITGRRTAVIGSPVPAHPSPTSESPSSGQCTAAPRRPSARPRPKSAKSTPDSTGPSPTWCDRNPSTRTRWIIRMTIAICGHENLPGDGHDAGTAAATHSHPSLATATPRVRAARPLRAAAGREVLHYDSAQIKPLRSSRTSLGDRRRLRARRSLNVSSRASEPLPSG
jgi:hypothetical protein